MKKVEIALDDNSIEILKKVDDIHRNSIVNVALSLVSKTGYYKTLAGEQESEDLEDIVSLDVESDKKTSSASNTSNALKKTKKETPSPVRVTSSWDNF